MPIRILLCLILFLSSSQLPAQFTIQQVLDSPFPTSLTADKTQNRVTWVFNHAGKRNIWMADLDANTSTQLTSFEEDNGQDISNLIFRNADNSLLFIYGGAPNRRGEIPNPTSHPDGANRQIMKLDLNSKEMITIDAGAAPSLSPDESRLAYVKGGKVWFYDFESQAKQKAFEMRGGPSSLRWSPDSRKLAFVSNRGDHDFIGVYDLEKHSVQYLAPSVDHDGAPVWSPDGQQLAFLRIPNEKSILPFIPRRSGLPWSIWKHDFQKNETQQIWKAQDGVGSVFRNISAANQLFWMADNHIIFPYEGEGWTQLYSIPADGGPAKWLTPGAFEVQFVSQDAQGQYLYYSSNQEDINRQHIWRVSSTSKPELMSGKTGIQWSPVTSKAGQLLCLASSETTPAQLAQVENGKVQILAPETLPKDFPSKQLVAPEAVLFPASDGMMIHGQLFKPKKMERGKQYPAVLFFHGGSRRQMLMGFHHRGYYHNAYALNQYLASQGYIVLSVNYRSGIGYGMEFREALNYGARGASEFNDVMGAGLYLKGLPEVNPEQIGLWGGSYGGYLTALGLAKASDLFAAGVDIHGVHDWNVVIKNFVSSYDASTAKGVADLAIQSSPMPYVDGWRSPVLFIHGDDDRNVPFSETVDIVEALRRQDTYFEQLIFPDEVHGFLLHRNWVAAYEATADFFNRKLKH
ncbi:MAG: prolyl oligopeptidase family serine peptidase [Bacteroidota bacterium]